MNFSIVIPLYNKEQYIERCLDSILAQSYKNFEIIIVDDGSTDGGIELVRAKYNLVNMTILVQQNSGVSKARNAGVAIAKSKWVAFLDADDYWQSGFLSEVINTIKIYPDISLCSSGYQFLSKNHCKKAKLHVSGETDYRVIDNYFLSSCKGDLPITASSVVVNKTDFLSIGGFPEGWTMGEDIYLWMKMAINFKLAICMKVLVTYDHTDENSATKINPVLEVLPHVNALEAWLYSDAIPERLKKDAANLLHRSYIYTAFQNIKYGNKHKASSLISNPNVFKGWHKFIIQALIFCPSWLIKRLN